MRIKLNYDKKIPMRIGVFSAVVAVFVGTALLSSHVTNSRAVGEEESPRHTFTQTARVFDGEGWNEVQQNDDGSCGRSALYRFSRWRGGGDTAGEVRQKLQVSIEICGFFGVFRGDFKQSHGGIKTAKKRTPCDCIGRCPSICL